MVPLTVTFFQNTNPDLRSKQEQLDHQSDALPTDISMQVVVTYKSIYECVIINIVLRNIQ